MIAVTMDAWRGDEQSESLEELEGGERESGAATQCGMGKTIDDALASGRAVPGSLESFEGEGRTGAVAQESFQPSTVVGSDVNRRIDAEPTGGLPAEHVIGDVTFEQTVAVEVWSTRWRTVCCSLSQSEAVRGVASWNWTKPSGSSQNTPSMTQTWKWKCAFRDEPNR